MSSASMTFSKRLSRRTALILLILISASYTLSRVIIIQPKLSSNSSLLKSRRNTSSYPAACKKYFDKENYGSKIRINANEDIFPFPTGRLEIIIPKTIHFINYNANLRTARYLCALESAISNNPDYLINLYTPDPVITRGEIKIWIDALPEILSKRVKLVELDYKLYFKDTPLDAWFAAKLHEKSYWIEQNLGNAIRLAILWKVGGTYFDLDIISINPLMKLERDQYIPIGRFIAREENEQLNNAALRFPVNDAFVWALMENFVQKFDGYTWYAQSTLYHQRANNGPFCVTRTYKEKCSLKVTQSFYPDALHTYCNNLDILEISRFYPIHFRKTSLMLAPFEDQCGLLSSIAESSLGVHWWHKTMENDEKKADKTSPNSLIGKLFEVQCPSVVNSYGWNGLGFGTPVLTNIEKS